MSHTREHTTGRPQQRPENPVLVKIRSIACLLNRDIHALSRGQGLRVGVSCPNVNHYPAFTEDGSTGMRPSMKSMRASQSSGWRISAIVGR
jgi:hypothetical protein